MGMTCGLQRVSNAQIEELLEAPQNLEEEADFLDESSHDNTTYLDKAWHGIHFLLTGLAWGGEEPLCYLLVGGESLNNGDGGGWSRILRPAQIASFDEALQKISTENFRERFAPQRMIEEEIYPTIWDCDPRDNDTLSYLADYFEELKNFVHLAHENNQGLIIFIG